MPPAKSSRNNDSSKTDMAGSKDKSSSHSSAKMRRVTSQQGGSNLREVTNASATASTQAAEPAAPSLQWSTFDRDSLHAYCREYHLNTPGCFTSTFHETILAQPGGIGLHSPTMLRRKKQRQNKEQLAKVVRKHFNGLGIQENDAIVEFIYKVRSDKASKSRGGQKPSSVITD